VNPGRAMSGDRRSRWDERYLEGDWVDVEEPATLLRESLPLLSEAEAMARARGSRPLALDVACGAGRNTLFLARRGWRVMGVDLSVEGLRLLERRARSEGLPVLPVLADAGAFQVRPRSFDLVVNTFFLLREAFPLLRQALRPGGLLLFETFSVLELDELGGDIRREFALEQGELLRAFPDLQVLLHEEGIFERDEGERGLARLVARSSP
jgi:tellurite methyltransferase